MRPRMRLRITKFLKWIFEFYASLKPAQTLPGKRWSMLRGTLRKPNYRSAYDFEKKNVTSAWGENFELKFRQLTFVLSKNGSSDTRAGLAATIVWSPPKREGRDYLRFYGLKCARERWRLRCVSQFEQDGYNVSVSKCSFFYLERFNASLGNGDKGKVDLQAGNKTPGHHTPRFLTPLLTKNGAVQVKEEW